MEELQGLQAELLRDSGSLGAQWAARLRAVGKVRECEAKEGELRRAGKEGRADLARGHVEKAARKAKDKQANVEHLEGAVARLEDWVGRGRKVKEEVKEEEEVVVEEKVSDDVKAEVVEEKVEGTGMAWWRGFSGNRGAGAIMDMPWDAAVPAGPHPLGLDNPLLLPLESPVWTLRFVMHRVHHKTVGQGMWVWVDEQGVHINKPLRVGVFRGYGNGSLNRRKGGRESGPPFRQGGGDV